MKKIFILEDDRDTLFIFKSILEDLNYAIIISEITPPASEIARINPDLIIVDHKLSDGWGSQFCLELKSNQQTSDIPVMLTSCDPFIEVLARNCLADKFVAKPFDLDEFINVVQNLIGMPEN